MDDKEQLLLLYTIVVSVLLVVVTIVFTDRINRLEDRLDQLEKNTTVTVIESPDLHTLTDAVLTDTEYSTYDTLEGSEKAFKGKEVELSTEEEKDVPEASESFTEPTMTYLGVYELTAYEWTGEVCADGNYPSCGYTVGCNSLPLGTRIYIEDYGIYVVQDRGGMPDNFIDIYMEDYDTCIEFGRRTADVYLIE